MNFRFFLVALGLVLTLPAWTMQGRCNLVQNPGFESTRGTSSIPSGYDLMGAAHWGRVGRRGRIHVAGHPLPGIAKDGGSVSQTVRGIDQAKGRWLTFRFRGLPEEGFAVTDSALAMKIEFYSKNGTDFLDGVTRLIYREIENDRQNLTINGDYGRNGAAVWRSYELEELIPFPEVDTVKISVI